MRNVNEKKGDNTYPHLPFALTQSSHDSQEQADNSLTNIIMFDTL